MEVGSQPKLRMHGVDFVKIDFQNDAPYDNKGAIKLDVVPRVFYPKSQPKFFKIIMEVSLVSESFFSLRVLAVGNFELDIELPKKQKSSFVNKNAPAIMFPYVRSFISTLTSNLGNVTGHLMIPTQFFKGDLEELSDEVVGD